MVTEDFVPLAQPIHTTDVIISQYENILSKKISAKALSAARNGKTITFTDEETAYLTKKAIDEDPHAEVSIDTSAPDVTLKKGNTEINIKHAALLVKKMEEKFPKSGGRTFRDQSSIFYKDDEFPQPAPPEPVMVQSVNKNPYELREIILELAINEVNKHKENLNLENSVEKILETAYKFYSFVENKSGRR